MRALLVILGLLIVIVVLMMSLGWINIDQTRPGALPSVKVEGGQAPAFQASGPTVTTGTVNETVSVPTVSVQKPGEAPQNAQ